MDDFLLLHLILKHDPVLFNLVATQPFLTWSLADTQSIKVLTYPSQEKKINSKAGGFLFTSIVEILRKKRVFA
jgi:hypothetical protein